MPLHSCRPSHKSSQVGTFSSNSNLRAIVDTICIAYRRTRRSVATKLASTCILVRPPMNPALRQCFHWTNVVRSCFDPSKATAERRSVQQGIELMRRSIIHQILDFKKSNRRSTCPKCSKKVTWHEVDVDHTGDYEFQQIVAKFLAGKPCTASRGGQISIREIS